MKGRVERRAIGSGVIATVALVVAFLLPVTFPQLSGFGLSIAWALTAVLFLIGLWLIWHKEKPKPIQWKTVREFYETDFPLLKMACAADFTVDGEHMQVPFCFVQDFAAHSEFAMFYVPPAKHPIKQDAGIIRGMALNLRSYRDQIHRMAMVNTQNSSGDDQVVSTAGATFTGRVYAYHNDHLEPRQVADLIEAYKGEGLDLQLRGPNYAKVRNLTGEP